MNWFARLFSTSVETNDEYNWRVGKKFALYHLDFNTVVVGSRFLVLKVGAKSVAIDKIEIKGNSAWLKWSWYTGDLTVSGGTEINELPMNPNVDSSSGAKLYLNPVISGPLMPIYENVPIYGDVGANAYTIMNSRVVDRKVGFKPNTYHVFKIENIDESASHIDVLIDFEVL